MLNFQDSPALFFGKFVVTILIFCKFGHKRPREKKLNMRAIAVTKQLIVIAWVQS